MDMPRSALGPHVESWHPDAVADTDELTPEPVAAMSALFGEHEAVAMAGDRLPPLWHWLYFLRWPAQQDLGDDGHPRHGPFLPPIPDRQRMFAGGRCQIIEPLRLGERVRRVSSLNTVTVKQGKTGELLFVTVRSEYGHNGRICLVEEQDIVYRSGRSTDRYMPDLHTTMPPRSDEPLQLPLRPDPTLLFRFSALTANAHRIHYDAPYAQMEEGYPGLVVHGPLLVLAMLELVRRNAPDRCVRSLSYRLRRPAFLGEHLLASGRQADGRATMRVGSDRELQHATAEVVFA
ncbi:MaoC family dehydratase N-terminal domain-containing protein [Streptomyces sp. KL116D]|uniref:FAS1-like dehydratase domain-containing protein n=1 Tax=Streptomyces sp. KL116D TaxID=3045152 RepID=UPI003558BB0D